MSKHRIVAVIPARGGSKGIPGKNIIDFCGKPLIAWSIEQALGSALIERVYVSSDDAEICKISEYYGATAIKRPASLATASASTEGALSHAVRSVEDSSGKSIDAVVFLQATSPLRVTIDINSAIDLFVSKKADSLFSGSLLDDFCVWERKGRRLNSLTYDYKNRGRRQEREPLFLENGSIYIFKPSVIRRYNNRLGGRIVFYPMPFWKSYEIDKSEDVEICEYYMRKNILRKGGSWCKD
ncbi:MAG: acylneuraminate cytidylyltransferase family protein [Candidatus Omnitrophica bacterium]|nr:acylneuraminate cytidylyltransferase family protein [Candidatus Omnitrophota bacterium]